MGHFCEKVQSEPSKCHIWHKRVPDLVKVHNLEGSEFGCLFNVHQDRIKTELHFLKTGLDTGAKIISAVGTYLIAGILKFEPQAQVWKSLQSGGHQGMYFSSKVVVLIPPNSHMYWFTSELPGNCQVIPFCIN